MLIFVVGPFHSFCDMRRSHSRHVVFLRYRGCRGVRHHVHEDELMELEARTMIARCGGAEPEFRGSAGYRTGQ